MGIILSVVIGLIGASTLFHGISNRDTTEAIVGVLFFSVCLYMLWKILGMYPFEAKENYSKHEVSITALENVTSPAGNLIFGLGGSGTGSHIQGIMMFTDPQGDTFFLRSLIPINRFKLLGKSKTDFISFKVFCAHHGIEEGQRVTIFVNKNNPEDIYFENTKRNSIFL